MSNSALEFYKTGSQELEVIEGKAGEVSIQHVLAMTENPLLTGDIPDDVRGRLANNIGRLYAGTCTYQARAGGTNYNFEIGVVDQGVSAELRSATYTSSLSNPGNGFEVARWALDNPGTTYVYVGSPVVGPSSPLSSKEQRYFRKYGSMLYQEQDGARQPLPYIRALAKVLKGEGLASQIEWLGSDSAGAAVTTAYGAAFGDGQIIASHQNVRTGFFDRNIFQMLKAALIDNPRLSTAHANLCPDAYKVNDKITEFVRDNAPEYFGKLSKKISLAMELSYAVGLGRGPQRGDPLVSDNLALREANPDARILFSIGAKDPFSRSSELEARVRDVVARISAIGRETVNAVIVGDSGHNLQTHDLQYLQAINSAVLNKR